jgi:hypothetical protein
VNAQEMHDEIVDSFRILMNLQYPVGTQEDLARKEYERIRDAILSRLKMLELAQSSCIAEQAYRYEDMHGETDDLSDLDITWTDARLAWLAEYERQKGQNEQG